METITATFKVVTPMFMSGANQQGAELRLPSIKGVLRFWWRALANESFNGNLELIRQEENIIFGSTDSQAKVLMRLDFEEPIFIKSGERLGQNCESVTNDAQVVGNGARYLGYGVIEAFVSRNRGVQAGQLIRPCLKTPFELTLHLSFQKSLTDDNQKQRVDGILNAFKIMGLLGGLGSKSRKGYGSINLTKLKYKNTEWTYPKSFDSYKQEIETLISPAKQYSHRPKFTAFSDHTHIVLLKGDNEEKPLALLDRIGKDFLFYRSWGRSNGQGQGIVLGQRSEENFRDDHDLMKPRMSSPIQYPKRVVFGLPHNYGRTADLHVSGRDHDRRSSPLFFHIHHPNHESPPIAALTLLQAEFLPSDTQISVGGNCVDFDDNQEVFWRPANNFLSRMLGKQNLKPRRSNFTQVAEI